jgi:hypothetical protein
MSRSLLTSGLVVVSLCMAGARSASAQNPGNPPIQDAIVSVQQSIDTLQKSVDALGSESKSNLRVTPPVVVSGPDQAVCGFVNISADTRIVQTEIFDIIHGKVDGPFVTTADPGKGAFFSSSGGFLYCRMTVLDGVKADIRASMSVCAITACKQTVAAE